MVAEICLQTGVTRLTEGRCLGRTCNRIISTPPVKCRDGFEVYARHCDILNLLQSKVWYEYGRMKHYASFRYACVLDVAFYIECLKSC